MRFRKVTIRDETRACWIGAFNSRAFREKLQQRSLNFFSFREGDIEIDDFLVKLYLIIYLLRQTKVSMLRNLLKGRASASSSPSISCIRGIEPTIPF